MDLGLRDRRCVVTGGSRGIGREVAAMLVAEGAGVLLVARDEGDLAAAAAEIDGAVDTLACDVTADDGARRIADAAEDALGGVDVLVNNAGQAHWRDLDDVPDPEWDAAWELNVMAPLRLCRAVVPAMRERAWGRIVFVASTAGKRPSTNLPEYSVAKAAQLSLSRLLADRHASAGVLVNAVCPGPTSSDMWMEPGALLDQMQAAGGHPDRDSALASLGQGRPIGRVATPQEIAAAVVFLCSDRAAYVSGAAWSVDGGTVPVII